MSAQYCWYVLSGCIVHTTGVFLSLNDDIIPNHAYVNLSLMMYPGDDDTTADISSTVICHTDLTTCCRGGGSNQGNWYFPDGVNPLPGAGFNNENQEHPIAQRKQDQLIRLQRGSTTTGTVPSGIYRCDVETVAANNTVREMVYVGVYGSGGT